MSRPLLPTATSRGILSGQARLFLPVPGAVLPMPYQPPSFRPERADYAKPVRLDLPSGWRAGSVGRLDVVFLIDESGSMYCPAGDPSGIRRAVALSVVDLLIRAI
jgi:hypothetical protein